MFAFVRGRLLPPMDHEPEQHLDYSQRLSQGHAELKARTSEGPANCVTREAERGSCNSSVINSASRSELRQQP